MKLKTPRLIRPVDFFAKMISNALSMHALRPVSSWDWDHWDQRLATHVHLMDPGTKGTQVKASKKLAFNPYLENLPYFYA